MAYIKNTWVNNETEVNAQNMQHIEDGIENTQNVKLLAINTQAPSQCATGDKYYNKTTKKIYTAIATNTWGETGENPIPDIIYIVFSEKGTYSYDGDTLVSVGGGSGAYIGTTEPPEDDNSNLWVNPEEVFIRQDNIVKTTYNESDDNTYSTNYINDLSSYSLEEQRVGTWIDGKPIYRKVYTSTANSANTIIETFANISNWNIITLNGWIYKASTIQQPIGMYANNNNYSGAWVDENGLKLILPEAWVDVTCTYHVIVEYTKTTD